MLTQSKTLASNFHHHIVLSLNYTTQSQIPFTLTQGWVPLYLLFQQNHHVSMKFRLSFWAYIVAQRFLSAKIKNELVLNMSFYTHPGLVLQMYSNN